MTFNPLTPAAIRPDVDDCAALYLAKDMYMQLTLVLTNKKNLEQPTYQYVADAIKAHEEAGRALFRIAERHK